MRRIEQPGPEVHDRIQGVEARGRAFAFTLEAGVPLLEAVRRGFAQEGFAGGVVNWQGGMLGPFAYVMPALSKTGENAAFYSDTFRPAGPVTLATAAMTFGERDGAPFFHCHALWTEADGRITGGHILPDETLVAAPFQVQAYGIDGALFRADPDPETRFKLFGPVAAPPSGAQAPDRAFALRLRPNQDFAGALEGFCRDHGIARANVRGGVGSIIGARFADGRIMEPFATELAVRAATIAPDEAGSPRGDLDIVLVDYQGGIGEGPLARGDNPVLMTMELVLQVF